MKKIGIIAAVVIVLGFIIIKYFVLTPDRNIQYTESLIKRGNIQVTILATGMVQPENRLEIKPPVAGRIEKVLVEEGVKVKKGQILAWMSSTERAALIDSARAQGAEEQKKWEEIYRPTPIMAPLSGTIIQKNIESGQTFTTNDAVLVMSNRLTIKAQVDETDLAQIKKDQHCEVRLDSYPDEKINSKVERIAFEAKTISNVTTYVIDVLPDITPEFMRSGMTANITFFVSNKENIIVVPTEYISYEMGQSNVLIKEANKKYSTREIKLGVSEGKLTEVISGLNEGEIVVLKNIAKKEKKSNPFMPSRNRTKQNNSSPKTSSGGAGGSERPTAPSPGK